MGWTTHEVSNQVPDLVDYNLCETDMALQEAVLREGAQAAVPALSDYGRLLGQARIIALDGEINRYSPRLRAFDRQGHRIDEVDYHPGWHDFMAMGCGQARHGHRHGADREAGRFRVRHEQHTEGTRPRV